jgi:hypothetical protein
MTRRARKSSTGSRVARPVALVAVLLAACAAPNRTALMSTQPAGLAEHRGSPFYSSIVELRQYTLHPGRRDDLIRLFDAEFIEPQEKVGIKVIGQFRNLDDPNKFVWLRGFPDMDVRQRGLTQFYSGNAWRSRRNDANATIIDNDNVLLLRPVRPDAAFDLDGRERPPPRHRMTSSSPPSITSTPRRKRNGASYSSLIARWPQSSVQLVRR